MIKHQRRQSNTEKSKESERESERDRESVKDMEWIIESNDLLRLRQVLHLHSLEAIQTTLIRYTEMIQLFSANFPTWLTQTKVDWSIAVAMAPNW